MMMMVITDNYPFHLFGIFYLLKYLRIDLFTKPWKTGRGNAALLIFERRSEAKSWGSLALGHVVLQGPWKLLASGSFFLLYIWFFRKIGISFYIHRCNIFHIPKRELLYFKNIVVLSLNVFLPPFFHLPLFQSVSLSHTDIHIKLLSQGFQNIFQTIRCPISLVR